MQILQNPLLALGMISIMGDLPTSMRPDILMYIGIFCLGNSAYTNYAYNAIGGPDFRHDPLLG